MYSENGSPLPLDSQLRLPPNVSSFLPVPVLRCRGYDVLGVSAIFEGRGVVAGEAFLKRK